MAKTRVKTETPLTALLGVVWGVRVVVVLVLERVFVVGGDVVAVTRVLTGRCGELDQISVAID